MKRSQRLGRRRSRRAPVTQRKARRRERSMGCGRRSHATHWKTRGQQLRLSRSRRARSRSRPWLHPRHLGHACACVLAKLGHCWRRIADAALQRLREFECGLEASRGVLRGRPHDDLLKQFRCIRPIAADVRHRLRRVLKQQRQHRLTLARSGRSFEWEPARGELKQADAQRIDVAQRRRGGRPLRHFRCHVGG